MNELLTSSLLWRFFAAFAALLSRSPIGRFFRYLGALWRDSATYRFFARLFCAEPVADRSAYRRLLDRCNAALYRLGRPLLPLLQDSAVRRVYGRFLHALRESFLIGRLFSGGMTSFLLLIIAAMESLAIHARITGTYEVDAQGYVYPRMWFRYMTFAETMFILLKLFEGH